MQCHRYIDRRTRTYRKVLIVSPGVIFVQKASLLGLFLGELIFGGACYPGRNCAFQNWLDSTTKKA